MATAPALACARTLGGTVHLTTSASRRRGTPPRALAALAATATLALALSGVAVAPAPVAAPGAVAQPSRCPDGTITLGEYLAAERRVGERAPGALGRLRTLANALLEVDPLVAAAACVPAARPERFDELALRAASLAAPRIAPFQGWRAGARAAAIEQRQAMEDLPVPPGAAGQATPYGRGPLVVDDPRYGTAALGLADNAGRIDDLVHDPGADPATVADDRVFAAVGNGGIWLSEDLGESWRSISETLPNQVSSAVAFTSFGGDDGTLLALTGDATYGSLGDVGTGAYWSRDVGATWTKAEGVPDGALAFVAAVHPTRPEELYLGTSLGLFRSTDGGETFGVVPLPVGPSREGGEPCDGVVDIIARPDCTFANHVTDVAIQGPGGTTDVGDEPAIVAALGWRGGRKVEPGTDVVQGPANGIYRSTDGGATFTYVPPPPADRPDAFAEAERIGRVELGAATGPDQDHGYLYAIVQDAVALNGGTNVIDVPEGDGVEDPTPYATNLEGVYVSPDFGASWRRVADDTDFQSPASGSGLIGAIPLGFAPGIQAWYNLCVEPDPTQADPVTGAPTRLIVCLEEVWQNEDLQTGVRLPVIGPSSFKVIGRYFSGQTCAFLLTASPCPTDRPPANTLTTHPDQQDALFVPIPADDPAAPEGTAGGVSLLMGNDGGLYQQTVAAGAEFDNGGWGAGRNDGFNTLLPYAAAGAKDGTVYMGLQDNGSALIDPRPNPVDEGVEDPRDGQELLQYEVIGGDGFFVAVDPDNSDVAYTERPFADMTVTTDRGITHSALSPPVTNTQFSNPFVMDPTNARHLLTAGCEVVETTFGPGTGGFPGFDWTEVFQLGAVDGGPCPEADEEGPFRKMTAVDLERDAAYVGFCGVCDILNVEEPFRNGLATNVAGEDVPRRATSQGWRFAAAEGLPNRWITSIQIDPQDVRTIYVTLGGYNRSWTPPGSLGDVNEDVGEGHLFVSYDAGETFTDISSNLPDVHATWVALRGARQLVVGTDIGAFVTDVDGVVDDASFVPLPGGPRASVATIEVSPHDQDLLTIAYYGRGAYQYRFDERIDDIDEVRLAGAERVATSVLTAREQFPRGTRTVVLARADTYADALVAVPLAFRENAPILLTYPDALHPEAAAAVEQLGATRAVLIGSLSDDVEAALRDAGIEDVQRLGGDDAFATAVAVGEQLLGSDDAAPQVYVAEGVDPDPTRGWPDTMAIGPLAATQGRPILLVSTEEAPAATLEALADWDVEEVTVVGGSVAVSDAVREEIAGLDVAVEEIAGATRYETSAAIADIEVEDYLDERRLWLATGDNYPDALSAGSSVALNGGTLLLVPRDDLDNAPPATTFIRQHADDLQILRFLGGEAAITSAVQDQVRAALGLGPPPVAEPPPLVGEVLAGPFGFETGPEGWETFTTDDVTMWRTSPPGDASGQSFQVAPYNNEASAVLVSPAFEHPGGLVRVTWAQRLNTEEGFDFLSLGWAGETRANVVAGFSGVNADYPLFTPQEAVFEAPAGELRIFFRLASDQLVNGEGAYVDNVVIER